jgi:glycosidase
LGKTTIYEINVRLWLSALAQKYGRPILLDTVPDDEVRRLGSYGFDAIWLMGVWAQSPQGRQIALHHAALQNEYRQALPDLKEEDVLASPFAVYDYSVNRRWGGEEGLHHLRARLRDQGTRLLLDFVPNHLALDHPWTRSHPEYFVQGSPADLEQAPDSYFVVEMDGTRHILAHGRDPYFPPWTDTVQLNYMRPETRAAMLGELQRVADQCDGVRCDMAMLVTNEVFARVWGQQVPLADWREPPVPAPHPHPPLRFGYRPLRSECRQVQAGRTNLREDRGPGELPEFWSEVIPIIKEAHPGFLFVAEVYWDMERQLQRQGFDLTYDKNLYDHLRRGSPDRVRADLMADLDYQGRLLRFSENHDELRAVTAFGREKSKAAAALVATLPGACLFHDGQLEGLSIRSPVQLGRRRAEEPDPELMAFYRRLIEAVREPVFKEGDWTLLESRPAWDGNDTHHNIIAYLWTWQGERRLVAVNLGDGQSQCLVPVPMSELGGKVALLEDLLGDARYERAGDEMLTRGLYLDMPPYLAHIFRIKIKMEG